MTTPRTSPNIYSLKQEAGADVRSVKINTSHVIHAGKQQQKVPISCSVTQLFDRWFSSVDAESCFQGDHGGRSRVGGVWQISYTGSYVSNLFLFNIFSLEHYELTPKVCGDL